MTLGIWLLSGPSFLVDEAGKTVIPALPRGWKDKVQKCVYFVFLFGKLSSCKLHPCGDCDRQKRDTGGRVNVCEGQPHSCAVPAGQSFQDPEEQKPGE